MDNFESQLRQDLHQFLLSINEVDDRLPECPDVEERWESIAKAYIPDGTKEAFNAYVACLHQLYLFGIAIQLCRMGYHMTKMTPGA